MRDAIWLAHSTRRAGHIPPTLFGDCGGPPPNRARAPVHPPAPATAHVCAAASAFQARGARVTLAGGCGRAVLRFACLPLPPSRARIYVRKRRRTPPRPRRRNPSASVNLGSRPFFPGSSSSRSRCRSCRRTCGRHSSAGWAASCRASYGAATALQTTVPRGPCRGSSYLKLPPLLDR